MGDFDCITLLGNVHILCIIPSEIKLIGTKVLESYTKSRQSDIS
jgi:hypothetical protein